MCYQALDITQRKKAEAALLAATSAQLAAEGMARTKSSFLANMSHEIRTPMNAVLGLSRMLMQEALPPAAHEKLAKVQEAARALTRILDDVLDFSKIEAGALTFECRPFSLEKVLNDSKSLFSANALEQHLVLAVDMPFGVPMQLVGDAFRLSQVLNNLISNALKFTSSGEVRIAVAPVDSPAPRAGWINLRFSVRDTGKGIAAVDRETLFQPYTQGDTSVTRRFGGTGLGLAICSRLVEQMKGRIGVNSELGRGSEFWFTASFEVAPSSSAPTPEAKALPPERSGLDALQVLLVEDNPLNQVVGVAVLETMGLKVTVACHGADAVAEVSSHPDGHFDVVLMDLHMPEMDGLEATRRIRALPQGAGLPILALTAAALPEDREKCLAAGMDGHVAKPVDPDELRTALRLVMPRSNPFPGPVEGQPLATSDRKASPGTLGLPDMPAFDLAALMARVDHNETMVLRLLELFVEQNRATAQELETLLRERQLDEARFRTHTLMGSAADLGATRVAQASAELHAALRDSTETHEMLQALKDALRDSVADAQRALNQRRH